MYLNLSITIQISKKLHIMYLFCKAITNPYICSWCIIWTAKMLSTDPENVLLLFSFICFLSWLSAFLLFVSLGIRTNPLFFLFAVSKFYIWNVFYIYFRSSKYLNLCKINQIGTMKQRSGPAWPPNLRTINNFLSDHRLTVSSIRVPLIFRKWKLSAVCLLT